MSESPPPPRRRRVLGMLAGLPLAGPARIPSGAPIPLVATPEDQVRFPDGATMLVAGPNGGLMAQWAGVMRPALARALAPGLPVRQTNVGGPDGVTAANEFEVRVAPDGRTILLAPGGTALSWLVGDPRAKFETTHWVLVMACVTPAVFVARAAALAAPGTIRVAATTPAGPQLPGLLAIEMLGQRAQLVAVPQDDRWLYEAFAQRAVDATLLCGHDVPRRVAALAEVGAVPAFTLGAIDALGRLVRAAQFPDVPSLAEFYARRRGSLPRGPMFDAWRAASVAAQLEFGIVLSPVTPADMVALWRRAGVEASKARAVEALARSYQAEPIGGPEAAATTAALAVDGAALTSLRQWLAAQYNWRPV